MKQYNSPVQKKKKYLKWISYDGGSELRYCGSNGYTSVAKLIDSCIVFSHYVMSDLSFDQKKNV